MGSNLPSSAKWSKCQQGNFRKTISFPIPYQWIHRKKQDDGRSHVGKRDSGAIGYQGWPGHRSHCWGRQPAPKPWRVAVRDSRVRGVTTGGWPCEPSWIGGLSIHRLVDDWHRQWWQFRRQAHHDDRTCCQGTGVSNCVCRWDGGKYFSQYDVYGQSQGTGGGASLAICGHYSR